MLQGGTGPRVHASKGARGFDIAVFCCPGPCMFTQHGFCQSIDMMTMMSRFDVLSSIGKMLLNNFYAFESQPDTHFTSWNEMGFCWVLESRACSAGFLSIQSESSVHWHYDIDVTIRCERCCSYVARCERRPHINDHSLYNTITFFVFFVMHVVVQRLFKFVCVRCAISPDHLFDFPQPFFVVKQNGVWHNLLNKTESGIT